MKKLLLFVAAAALTGCGGQSHTTEQGSNAKPESGAPKPKPDSRNVLVAFGDSLTAGFGAEPGKSYPDYLQKEIDARHLPWRVVNEGVSGDTTTDGLMRVPEVLNDKPKIVILELGANDGLRGLPVETTKSNLDQIVEQLQKSGARVVLAGMTLPPNYGPDYITAFEHVYRDLTERYKLTLIPFLLQDVGGHPTLMQQDGLHPTAKGNQIVAANVMRVIQPLL